MPMPFVYGDTYGGVQGAAQGMDQSERNYVLGLIAAQQAAQRIMQEQQRINLGAEAARQNQSDVHDYRQAQIDLGRENAQTQIDRLNEEHDYRLKALAAGDRDRALKVEDLLNTRDALGDSWAKELNQAIEENNRVSQDYMGSSAERDAALAKVREYEQAGSIRPDPRVKGKYMPALVGEKVAQDPSFRDYIDKLNKQRAEFANAELPKVVQKAADTAKEHAERLRATQQIINAIHSKGFGVDPQSGMMIDTQTRKVYPFVSIKVPKASQELVPSGRNAWSYNPR